MWQTLSDAIVAKVQTSAFVADEHVYDYAKSGMDGYPTVTVTPFENPDAIFADTDRNRRTYNFAVRCYQERTESSEEESERLMRQLVDDLIQRFDADIYLNTALQGRGFAMPIPSRWSFVQGEQVKTRLAEIIVSCVVIQ